LILRAKRLGFTLREIADLIAESERGTEGGSLNLSRRQCTEQINLLERQKREIEAALIELRQVYSQHCLRDLARVQLRAVSRLSKLRAISDDSRGPGHSPRSAP
jgi:DNA-binding transcriptional MerR regulator